MPPAGGYGNAGTDVRLRDRRGGLGRVRAREPALRGPRGAGRAARGRRQGQLLLDPHPDRLPLHDEQPPHRLVPQDRGGAGTQRACPPLPPGARAWRLLVHQRHDLHARPGPRLRPVAPARKHRLGLGGRAPLLPALRGSRGRRRRDARGGGRVAGRAPADRLGAARRVPGGGGGGRDPEDRRLQPRRQRGVELLPGEPAERNALEHRARVPPSGPESAEPRHRHPCPCETDRDRGPGRRPARDRDRCPGGRRGRHLPGPARGRARGGGRSARRTSCR